jgi:hypothetical protein
MKHSTLPAILTSLLAGIVVLSIYCLLVVVPIIHKWEKQNNYPYGKLCDLYGTCNLSLSGVTTR